MCAKASSKSILRTMLGTRDCDSDERTGVHYQQRWHMDPLFNGWLTPIENDSTKAWCAACGINLRAHYKDLERHSRTLKHVKHAEARTAGNDDTLTFNTTEKADGELMEEQNMNSTTLNIECEDMGAELGDEEEHIDITRSPDSVSVLELDCDAIDISSFDRVKSTKVQSVSVKSKRSSVKCEGLIDGSRCIGVSSKRSRDDVTSCIEDKQQKKLVTVTLKGVVGRPKKLIDLNCNAPKREDFSVNNRLEPFSESSSTDALFPISNVIDSSSTGVSYPNSVKLEECLVISSSSGTVEEQDNDALTDQNRPIGDKNKRRKKAAVPKSWSQYKKVYRREWEVDPQLSDWVAPVHGDRCKAACKFCTTILRAHYADLRHHASTTKHHNNEFWFYNPGQAAVPRSSAVTDVRAVDASVTEKESVLPASTSSCYVLNPKSSWSKYKKRYRVQWESDKQFRGWIAPVPGDDTRARCRYCRILLRAHYNDLFHHSHTTKHATNVSFGKPCDFASEYAGVVQSMTEAESIALSSRQLSSRERSATMKRIAGAGRKLRTNSKQKQTRPVNNIDVTACDLCEPDESLASIESLSNIMSFTWNAPVPTETTLILPRNIHLDEALAASLPPQQPHAKFRVRKEAGEDQSKKRQNKMTEEFSEAMLTQLTRSITLWEFLELKIARQQSTVGVTTSNDGTTVARPRIENVLSEFEVLHAKVKQMSQEQLVPVSDNVEETNPSCNILVLNSPDLAQCVGLEVGKYEIRGDQENLFPPSLYSPRIVKNKSTLNHPRGGDHNRFHSDDISPHMDVSNIPYTSSIVGQNISMSNPASDWSGQKMTVVDYANVMNRGDYLGIEVNEALSSSEIKIEGLEVDIDDVNVVGGDTGEVVYISYEGDGDIDEETLSNLMSQYPGGYMLLNGTQ